MQWKILVLPSITIPRTGQEPSYRLPSLLTLLLGREQEIVQLKALLRANKIAIDS